jgi:predicted transcriptional regulator
MGDRERNERGQFEREHSNKDFLEAVRENEPASTTEVAEAVGVARQSASYRLELLKSDGLVQKKKVGPTIIWLIA